MSRAARTLRAFAPGAAEVWCLLGTLSALGVTFLWLHPALDTSAAFMLLRRSAPDTARYVERLLTWSVVAGFPILGLTASNLLQLHGLLGSKASALPTTAEPYPFDSASTNLVVGRVHRQDGSPSPNPGWLVLPERSLFTGMLVVGSTGSGKTAGAIEPFLKQLIHFHKGAADRRWAGLVLDVKGNGWKDVLEECRLAGREADFYRISLPDARFNLINRPDLNKTALAGALWRSFENVDDSNGNDNKFFSQSATTLAMQTLRLISLCGEVPTLAEVYRVSCSDEAFSSRLSRARQREATMTPEHREELASLLFWYSNVLVKMDGKTKSNIAATLNKLCTMFDEPEIKRSFCPPPAPVTEADWAVWKARWAERKREATARLEGAQERLAAAQDRPDSDEARIAEALCAVEVTVAEGILAAAVAAPTANPPEWETFPGFDSLIESGKVVVVSIPDGQYEQVSAIVCTLTKVAFMSAVKQRLGRAQGTNATTGRGCFLVADEFDKVVSTGDPEFFSLCREARCASIVASQSYSGFRSKLSKEAQVDMLLANLRTKVWLCLEDTRTAQDAADLCGKVEREKESRSVSESASDAGMSLLDRQAVREGDASASRSKSWMVREEHLFRPTAFTRLQAFQAIVKAFDGDQVLPPWVVYLNHPEKAIAPVVRAVQ